MKAAILEQAGSPLVIGDLAIANPGPHEVLIRTATGAQNGDRRG